MACFVDINVPQGSVSTHAVCGGIINIRLTANLPGNLPVQIFKLVKIWQKYGHKSVVRFFGPLCTVVQSQLAAFTMTAKVDAQPLQRQQLGLISCNSMTDAVRRTISYRMLATVAIYIVLKQTMYRYVVIENWREW